MRGPGVMIPARLRGSAAAMRSGISFRASPEASSGAVDEKEAVKMLAFCRHDVRKLQGYRLPLAVNVFCEVFGQGTCRSPFRNSLIVPSLDTFLILDTSPI
jgi:hypothetical protein